MSNLRVPTDCAGFVALRRATDAFAAQALDWLAEAGSLASPDQREAWTRAVRSVRRGLGDAEAAVGLYGPALAALRQFDGEVPCPPL